MKVSVCLACYNGEEYIGKQIHSILEQLSDNDELIISDDDSKDQTLKIVKAFNDPRIKIVKSSRYSSVIDNFENALLNATGDVIFLSDQDDIWVKDKVQKCLSIFTTGVDIILTDCSIINEYEEVIVDSYFNLIGSRKGFLKNLAKNSYMGCCMAFNKNVLKKALPFPKGLPMHDVWIGLIGELFFKVQFLNESMLLYRRHNNNVSFTSLGYSKFSFIKKLSFRISLISALTKRFVFKK